MYKKIKPIEVIVPEQYVSSVETTLAKIDGTHEETKEGWIAFNFTANFDDDKLYKFKGHKVNLKFQLIEVEDLGKVEIKQKVKK